MNWFNAAVPSRALVFLLPATMFGLGLPAQVYRSTGDGGILSLFLGLVLMGLGAAAGTFLVRRAGGANLPVLARSLFGKPLGTLVVLGYLVYWAYKGAENLRFLLDQVRMSVLPDTPLWATGLYVLAISGFAAAHGIEPLARLVSMIVVLFYPVAAVFLGATFVQGEETRVLASVRGDWAAVLRGASLVALRFWGLSLYVAVAPFLTETRRLLRHSLTGAALLAAIYLLGYTAIVAMLGLDGISMYLWPIIAAPQGVAVPGFVVERFDLLYLFLFLLTSFLGVAIPHVLLVVVLKDFLGLTRTGGAAGAAGLVVYALALLPPSLDDVLLVDRSFGRYLHLPFAFVIPLAMLGLARLRGAGAPREAGAKVGGHEAA